MIHLRLASCLRCSRSSTYLNRHYASAAASKRKQQAKSTPAITQLPQPGPSPPLPKKSRLPLYLAGFLIYGASIYLGSSLYHIYLSDPLPSTLQESTSLHASNPEIYNKIANHYDEDINLDELLMGLTLLRRSIFRHAKGRVLEVSAGTGRNLNYYIPKLVESLTLVDQSAEMLTVARDKLATLKSSNKAWREIEVSMTQVSLEQFSPPVNQTQFDTIVQSFGLCSVSDPSTYLTHLSSFCHPETGEILLLEHGRSHYTWLNAILDSSVHKHAEKWGCWYNRDIERIVEDCEAVEVIEKKRYHFGTTIYYKLRRKRSS